jgi:hypothetical protein
MNTEQKYDPEDLEFLLMHKQFQELYEDERKFVLQHIDIEGEEEYESLRSTLYTLHDIAFQDEMLEPDPAIKKALMREFEVSERRGFTVWLNSVFTAQEGSRFRQPAFRYGLAAACIVAIALVFVYQDGEVITLAENRAAPAIADSLANAEHSADKAEEENLFAEKLEVKTYPPAPKNVENEAPVDEPVTVQWNMGETDEMAVPDSPPAEQPPVKKIESDLYFTPEAPAAVTENVQDRKDKLEDQTDNEESVEAGKKTSSTTPDSAISHRLFTDKVVLSETSMNTGVTQTLSSPASTTFDMTTISAAKPDYTEGMMKYQVVVQSAPASQVRDVLDVLFTAH